MILATGIQPIRLPKDFKLPARPAAQIARRNGGPAAALNGGNEARPGGATAASAVPTAPVQAVPVQAPVAAGVNAGFSPRAAVMEEHLRTMQHFLASQQQFLTTYLGGALHCRTASRRSGGRRARATTARRRQQRCVRS